MVYIKQTDFDGGYAFSKVISIGKQNKTLVKVFPNPTHQIINITSKQNRISKIELYNQTGQLLMVKNLNQNNYTINLSGYKQGVYFVKIIINNGDVIFRKVLLVN